MSLLYFLSLFLTIISQTLYLLTGRHPYDPNILHPRKLWEVLLDHELIFWLQSQQAANILSTDTREFLLWILDEDTKERPSMDDIVNHPWLQTEDRRSYQKQPQFSKDPNVRGKTFRQLPYIEDKLVREMAQKGYAIEYLIGKGGYGAVYMASKLDFETGDRTPVAMKVIGGLNKRSERKYLMSHRFRTEMKIMETVEHPNLVKVFDVFREKTRKQANHAMEKSVFIFMELADSDLHRLIMVQKFIGEEQLRAIMSQILTGLECLHSMRIAHRDIKPPNILIFGNVAKLTDYSLVREVGNNPISISLVGTSGYRAPEILLENKSVGNILKVDIWAMGITVFQCLTGKRPDWKPEEVARKNILEQELMGEEDNEAPFMAEYEKMIQQVLNLQKSDEVRQFILSMLQFDPKDRPSATEARNDPWFNEAPLPRSRARTPVFDYDGNENARPWMSDNPIRGNDHSGMSI